MKKLLCVILTVLLVISSSFVIVSAEIDYIPIYTAEDLRAVDNNLAGNYILMSNIDLSEVTAKGGKYDFSGNGWDPIGSGGTYASGAFTGIFDGNGFEVSGLRISVTDMPSGASSKTARIGLFSTNSGIIKNLTVSGKISSTYEYGVEYIGGIVAYNSASIENCANKCDITYNYNKIQNGYIGGICSYSKGTISKCYNTGAISISNASKSNASTVYSAGIACGSGYINDCYNTGSIMASHNFGTSKTVSCGISAAGSASRVSHCYNIGTAVYAITNSSVVDCFHLNTKGIGGSGAKALSSEAMTKPESFTNFDFENTWVIDTESGYGYPQLISNRQVKPIVETGIEITKLPSKLIYIKGEELDVSGLEVSVIYSDNTKEQVTDYTLSGYDSSLGVKTITVAYADFTATFEVEVKYELGDVNLDGKINIFDVSSIQKHLAGIIEVDDVQLKLADTDKSGTVNIFDASRIQKHLAGIVSEL